MVVNANPTKPCGLADFTYYFRLVSTISIYSSSSRTSIVKSPQKASIMSGLASSGDIRDEELISGSRDADSSRLHSCTCSCFYYSLKAQLDILVRINCSLNCSGIFVDKYLNPFLFSDTRIWDGARNFRPYQSLISLINNQKLNCPSFYSEHHFHSCKELHISLDQRLQELDWQHKHHQHQT